MSTITTINASDLIANSRADLNTNFSNLNADKIETSTLDTDTTLVANSDAKIATQKAVKTYIDTSGGANASETARGIVEEATSAEVNAGTATGGTGARLFVNPSSLVAYIASLQVPIIRVYAVSGSPHTWSKPVGLSHVVVEVVGAGAAGGGVITTSGGGGGGGAGGYSRKVIAVGTLGATETVTTGAGGTGTTSTGNSGGTSSFGAHASATGGAGGLGQELSSAGGAGGVGSGGDVNASGGSGDNAIHSQEGSNVWCYSGMGGGSFIGGGASRVYAPAGGGISSGKAASAYGAGGSGAARGGTGGTSANGGAGADGVVIVTEYYV